MCGRYPPERIDMSVWTVTIVDDEEPIVRVYATEAKAMAAAVAADREDVYVYVVKQEVQ
jgi:hypothetical protein